MKNHLRPAATGMFAALGLAVICGAHAQTINGWGTDQSASGTTIVDSGSGGNFTVSGTPTGNADWRANLPTSLTLTLGETVTLSGSMSWTSGAMGGGVYRF